MITVHIIFNAHLDPVWLWPWQAGLDEVLNSSYYICDLLDRHPDIIYTRGEAWLYQQIARIDPHLFRRIRAHVEAGRWSVVGGWYIQPDCNLPSWQGLQKQVELGQSVFQELLGVSPRVAYNVDSFGHAATLPRLMAQYGQTDYVMMRPQQHEMALPSPIFRWRTTPNDQAEVTTFRITAGYCTPEGLKEGNILAATRDLPDGIDETMCFAGIGDHGGGPTEDMIAWCREHEHAFPGIRLKFSSPERYFEAIRSRKHLLPLVTGELQQHAIGCFSVYHTGKAKLRQAEQALAQAEAVTESTEDGTIRERLQSAWETVAFNHFHDALGGTCLPEAHESLDNQVGGVITEAEHLCAISLRKRLTALPADRAQRLVFQNASDKPFEDFVEAEPWLEWTPWQPSWRLLDERDREHPFQLIATPTGAQNQVRLLLPLSLKPSEMGILRIVDTGTDSRRLPTEPPARSNPVDLDLTARRMRLANEEGWLSLPVLQSFADSSDTWSHGLDRFPRAEKSEMILESCQALEDGPLLKSWIETSRLGGSKARCEWRVYPTKGWIDCVWRIDWNEEWRLCKLIWQPGGKPFLNHIDGIPGGEIDRPCDGREFPVRDWTMLRRADADLCVLSPQSYSLDVTEKEIGWTLLRSCPLACHEPNPGTYPLNTFSDRGEHVFRFRFLAASESTDQLETMATGLQRPPLFAEWTRGMARCYRGKYQPPAGAQP